MRLLLKYQKLQEIAKQDATVLLIRLVSLLLFGRVRLQIFIQNSLFD